ncbi:MAG TPA: ATP-binding protein [Cytophagales bacterium]|nr:ATP-binding protein [Cytophagales bacterium]HAA20588.1 ATP-binding protein [Cytophagales bacterium]HAP63122.1 ATP-binding protein [Cytophagales bacterium]
MLLNFSVENFGPIKERQTLSMEADKSDHLEEHYVMTTETGHRVLKLALIYGANASGKTTILKAIDQLRKLVNSDQTYRDNTLDYNPFLFARLNKTKPTRFAVDFIHEEVRYSYIISYNEDAIIEESLFYFSPNRSKVFYRKLDPNKQTSIIQVGSKIKLHNTTKKLLEGNTLRNDTVFGGYRKTNVEILQIQKALDWFKGFLNQVVYPENNLADQTHRHLGNPNSDKDQFISLLKKADFNISDLIIEESNQGLSFVEKAQNELYEKLGSVKRIKSFRVLLTRRFDDQLISIPFSYESEGTKRYYGLLGILQSLVQTNESLFIDELESSLHPELFQHFLLSFLVNAKQSQIIATTHYREVLNNRDLFRDDAIWFTDKPDGYATELYSLADFDTSVVRDTTNVLNAYKAGKLGGVPNLGDYYINIPDGQAEEEA